MTIVPVIRPPKGLCAPLIAFTVDREKLPQIGIELKQNMDGKMSRLRVPCTYITKLYSVAKFF